MNQTAKAMTECEAADLMGLKVATLRAWRHSRRGPRFVKFGRAVRYLPTDVDAFIEASRVDTGSASMLDQRDEERADDESA